MIGIRLMPSLWMILLAMIASCAATHSAKSPVSDRCPPEGTLIPIAKAAAPSFLDDLEGCVIAVDAVFHAPSSSYGVPKGYERWMAFMLTDEAGISGDGLTESGTHLGGLISKDKADVVFALKKGDKVRVVGKIVAKRFTQGLAWIYIVVDSIEQQ